MAQYKVPQDVEADDKLIGPFSFRQFVYLLIAVGLIAMAVGLFQLFPLLAIIPLPAAFLFAALALPLKKDQPMETYLAAIVAYYLKPRKRIWVPGQRESTIKIIAPKKVEDNRMRNITGDEATHRLSFLVDIVDTGGYAIKGASVSPMREDLIAEANATVDMFETSRFDNLNNSITRSENEHHAEVVKEMQEAITESEKIGPSEGGVLIGRNFNQMPSDNNSSFNSPVVVKPEGINQHVVEKPNIGQNIQNGNAKNVTEKSVKRSIIELANNSDFTVATIAKEANRINRKDEGEVFISLH